MPSRQVVAELADRFKERQTFDVADGATDLAQHEVVAFIALSDEVLDGVGDVRNDLNGGAEVIAASLAREDVLIDAAGGNVVVACSGATGKTLVVAEVEIGLGAVIGNE